MDFECYYFDRFEHKIINFLDFGDRKWDFPENRPTSKSCNFVLSGWILISRHAFESTESNSFISEVFVAI